MFTNGHGAEADVWGVGELSVSSALLDLGKKWMQGESPPTPEEALEKELEAISRLATEGSLHLGHIVFFKIRTKNLEK